MTREFIELPEFLKKWRELELTEEDLYELEVFLCKYPDKGDLIQGTGGLRKLRWNLKNRGKRVGIRTLYIDFTIYEKIYLITVYAKSEKVDLSKDEKKAVRKMIETLEQEIKGRKWSHECF